MCRMTKKDRIKNVFIRSSVGILGTSCYQIYTTIIQHRWKGFLWFIVSYILWGEMLEEEIKKSA